MSEVTMEKIVSLCKRRGIIFPSSEIYGGLGSVWDYGPVGVELKNNIKRVWWKEMVQKHDNIIGLDSAILMHPKTWVASGHVESFSDPLVDCKKCKKRFRADHLMEETYEEEIKEENGITTDLNDLQKKIKKKKIKCPECGGEFTKPRTFNLLMKTYLGPLEEESAKIYLRGETCQGIYLQYKNVLNSSRKRIPFGIAQIGKAFRNEITPGNFTFRMREFEQMEMQLFVNPKEASKWYKYWKPKRFEWYLDNGIKKENLRFRQHGKDERAHYAKDAWDIEYKFPIGWKELEGIHNRGDWDLSRHSEYSGEDLSYFDQEKNEKYIPWIVETSAGADRATLVFLIDAYHEEEVRGEKRVVLKFHKDIAPYKIAVLPLSKNKDLSAEAKEVYKLIKENWMTEYDETQSIGKRYRRQDEIGTLYCITIDFDSLRDKAVTVRDRDSMKQERVRINELVGNLKEKLG